ncbi:NUDIX hydrolase domain [Arabidopsis suecica]|uniref:Nudix hydrolase n=1 Tax=Arabidopsis suecica TaxID=45249 RepID=A0A8T2ECL7_ARASU|nr:NUDIX hydrolase domain [Arabidopsis suecica]
MSDQEAPLRNGVEHKIFEVLPFVDDDYGGVIVEMKTPMDTKTFVAALRDSFEQWRLQGKKGVWLNLPLSHVNLVEPAVKEGFRYHHAEPTYLMLVYWIPEAESTIPLNASHRVRVGAVVLNHNKEEKYGSLCGSGIWKIPTGVVDEGEEIFAAAIREVKEETGVRRSIYLNVNQSTINIYNLTFSYIYLQIDTEFLEILAFCQTHESFFAKSDLFFVCLLRPTSFDIQKQDLEIEAAQWMRFEDSASQPITHKNDLFKDIHHICSMKMEKSYSGFSKKPITTFFDDKLGYLYLNKQEDMEQPIS